MFLNYVLIQFYNKNIYIFIVIDIILLLFARFILNNVSQNPQEYV